MSYSRRQLEALGEPFGDSATQLKPGGRIYGGGGGGGTPATQTQIQELPEWARGYAQETLGKAAAVSSQPYQTYGAERLAGFSPLQLQAQKAAGTMGPAAQLDQATGLAGLAGTEAFRAGQYTPGQFMAERTGTGSFTQPGMAGQYMSPYIEQALAPQLREAQRSSDILGTQQAGQAVQSGAFGGSRAGLLEAERQRNLGMQMGDIRARGLQSAYEQAQQLYGTEQQRALQSQIANQQAGLQAQQLGEQSRQYGAGLGLQGLNTALSAAGQLGQLGQQQFGQQKDVLGLQSQFGAQQQELRQRGLSQAYQDFLNQQNYPYKQLGFMSDMIRGLPLGQQTTRQMYEGEPGLVQSIGSIGLGAAGLSKLGGMFKDGGIVELAEGGYAEISEKVRTNPTKYSEQQIRQAVKKGILDVKTAEMALEQIAKARKAAAGIDILPSGLPTQEYAPGGIVAFDEGGDVKRYQYGGVTRWEDLKPYTGAMEIDPNRVRAGLEQYYGISGGRAAFPRISPPSLRGDVRIDPLTGKPITYAEFLTRQSAPSGDPTAGFGGMPSAGVSPSAGAPPGGDGAADAGEGEGYFGGIGGGRPPVAAPAAAPDMTMDRILERAQAAGQRAVPAGLASLTMPTFTPAQMQEKYREAMPKGEAAFKNELTPEFEKLEKQRRSAAEEAFQESGKISDRMDKLREAQAARFQAKDKDIKADRDRSVGIAFLEAAQEMATPGRSLVRSLVTSGATGAKSFMASKERLDKRADELSDAVNRLDEARVGDARERAAAKANLDQAKINARTDMIRHNETALGMNREDARKAVDASLARDAAAANFQLIQQETMLKAQQGAEANAIRAAQVGVAASAAAADLTRAMRPGPQLELAREIGNGNALLGIQRMAQAQLDKNPYVLHKMYIDYVKDWDPLKRGRQQPDFYEFLAMMNTTVGGQTGAKDTIRPRLDAMKP